MMNSLNGSFANSLQMYLESNSIDLEIEPLLMRSKNSLNYDELQLSYADERKIDKRESKTKFTETRAPPDKFFIAALVAFFSGMAGILPLTFFVVANDYWMFKFRDTSQENYDLNNKTFLQKTFVSMISVCSALPSLVSVIVGTKFGHRIELRTRFLLALGFMTMMFVCITLMVEVNTDSWQTLFFILTLTLFAFTSFFQPFYGMTNMAYLSNFPNYYIELNMFGSAISGLFGTVLQIISLTIGKSSSEIALIYFFSGTVVMGFTCFLCYAMKYSATVQFYLEEGVGEKTNKAYTMKEYWNVGKKIWFLLVMLVIIMGTANMGHPNITNLVVSEGYTGNGENLWYDKYFVVVATYLLNDIFTILGRFFGIPLIKRKTAIKFICIVLFRSFILTPLLWFCNAQPRSNLPVWFPYDYQYMILVALNSFSLSVLLAMMFISTPVIAQEKTEHAFILIMAVSTISATVTSPLSPVYVNIL